MSREVLDKIVKSVLYEGYMPTRLSPRLVSRPIRP